MRVCLSHPILLAFLLLCSANTFAQPCNLSGVYKVGPSGAYPTLTAALAALRNTGVGNNVILELQSSYTSAGEIFPLAFNNIPCIGNSKTLTVRPEAGAGNLTISGNSAGPILDLNNARYIHVDGRPGGTGTNRALTIANSSGIALRFINDASFNRLDYVNIQGSGVQFGSSNMNITNGNNDNSISNCAIYNPTAMSESGVAATGTVSKKNRNNKLLNNLIYNSVKGVSLGSNNEGWEITGNHFYTTLDRVVNYVGILITDSTASGFNIHHNFIGGSAPDCGGVAKTFLSFVGIEVTAGTGSYTSIQGNTIANIKVTSGNFSTAGNTFAGISMHMGKFKCGDITGNTIGSQTKTSNIVIRGEDDFNVYGIVAGFNDYTLGTGIDTCYIMNNKIGGIYAYQANFNFSQTNTIAGIFIESQKNGFADVANNTVGSPTTAFSILHTIGFSELHTYGILVDHYNQPYKPENKIRNNEIANMAGGAVGIRIWGGRSKVLNNTIHHLYGHEALNYPGSPTGISMIQVDDGSQVSGNTIHSLTWTGQNFDIVGVYATLSKKIIIEKNFIHSFQANTSTIGKLTGILCTDENSGERIQNNMIRLGIDTAGNSTSSETLIDGISVRPGGSIITNNSVYIGGTGSYESVALRIRELGRNSKILNNILVNVRSAIASTFYNHYALKYEEEHSSNELNRNIYFANGQRGYHTFITIGLYQPVTSQLNSIIDWRKVSKQDSNSIFYPPNFVNPTGNASTVDLHLANPNPAEGQGVADAQLIDDIDNEQRIALSPVDIGADAGNFSYQDGDAPRISHKAFLGNPVPTSFVYTAQITDNGSGVDTTGNNKPRMWFRKKYPSVSNWSSLPGHLVSGTLNNGIWGFIPDFAGAGIPVVVGDSLEYYFVAQDKGPVINTGYSNVQGSLHTNVNTQTAAPANPLRLLIYGVFPDTVYVGAGQQFTSLTNDDGFFHKAEFHMFDTTRTNQTVIITSDLSESGAHRYTTINETGATIKIITNTPVVKYIRNQPDINYALIRFFDVRNVTLDGSVNGSGRYLHFISGNSNTIYSRPALNVTGGGKNITIRNAVFESNGTSNTAETVGISDNEFDTLLVVNNLFKNIESSSSAALQLPNTGLYIAVKNAKKIIIQKNEFTNFGQTGLLVRNSVAEPSGEVLIDSNHFYYNSAIAPINGRTAMDVQVSVKSIITNNYIGGSAPYCGGKPWTFNLQSTTTGAYFKGILVAGPNYNKTSSVQRNTIQNIRILNWGLTFIGIHAAGGSLDIGTEQPNMIGSLTGDSSIVNISLIQGIYGNIAIYDSEMPYIRIENNIIAGMTASYLEGINLETKRASLSHNLIQNLRSSGGTSNIPGFIGMKIWLKEGVIEGNRILDLVATQVTSAGRIYGMDIASTGFPPQRVIIARNKIAGLQSYWNGAYGTQSIIGIRTQFRQYTMHNNQVNLTNGALTNPVDLRGIVSEGSTTGVDESHIYYNTVRIGGHSPSNRNTYAALFTGGSRVQFFRNNILYNERTGGTGKHLAIGNLTSTADYDVLPAGVGNNNLYIVRDTNFVNEFRTNGAVSIRDWRNLSKGDAASYGASVVDVPADSLFTSPAEGDLTINTISAKSWYVNGKGLPVDSISGDYDVPAGVRSTSIAGGATDIGADEFTTSSAPPDLIVSGARAHGNTQQLAVNGRVVASITWGNTGTLPVLGEPLFYSGVWPNDTSNNGTVHFARFMNTYWHIPATGGSDYSYSITFHYDSSMLGKVTNAANMVVNKRQSGVNGSWQVIEPTVVNTALKTITIHNQTSFSEFTATDADATLSTGVPAPDLVISNASVTGAASTGSTITASFIGFNQGKAASAVSKVQFYLSADNDLDPGSGADTLLGEQDISSLNSNTGTGVLTKPLTIPCNLTPGTYFLFIVVDGKGVILETDETNNNTTVPLTITIGTVSPATPVITATPGVTACTPTNITLTANSAGCTNCTYNWSTGATGNSITVNSTGIYTVTTTNVCGQSSGSQQVTINTTPVVNLSTNNNVVCLGTPVTLSSSGATTYTWSGNGLNTTTGSSVIATPASAGPYTYRVIGESLGCTDTMSVSLTVNPLPVVNIVQADTSICTGSSVQLAATGAVSYLWSPSTGLSANNLATVTATPPATTTYTVIGTNAAGCFSSDAVAITALPVVAPSVSINYTGCPSNTLNFTAEATGAGTNPAFEWLVNNVAVGTGSTFALNNASNGTVIKVNLVSNATCANPATVNASVTVNCIITAVPDIDGLEDYSIVPNPSRGMFEMKLKFNQPKNVSVKINDLNGRLVYQLAKFNMTGAGSKQLNLTHLPAGIYYMLVTVGKQSFTDKLIRIN